MIRICLAIAALYAGLILAIAAWGAKLTDDQAALLYAAAWAQVPQYRLPDTAPRVVQVTQARLRSLAGCERCDVRAWSLAREVYVDERLDFADAVQASILLHEFVHTLQYAARGPARDCEDWAAREAEAYRAQLAVLEAAGAPVYAVRLAAAQAGRAICR